MAETELYSSTDSFSSCITAITNKAMAEFHPDIIIFPEYMLVFLGLVPYFSETENSETIDEAFSIVMSHHREIRCLKDIFLINAGYVKARADELFGTLSAVSGVYIIAGTFFHRKKLLLREPELVNRVLVYDPSGKCIYTQDKVFLTDFETDVIGLSPGNIENARGFSINGYHIGITICRDTYFSEWEQLYTGKDIWIDIKANGEFFTDAVRESFEDALPERICNTNVPNGITVCMTGHFLNLFWEGESSVIRKTGAGFEYREKAGAADSAEIIYAVIGP